MNPVKFLHETITELKMVQWPTRATTIRLTIIVIVLSAVIGAYVGGLDYVFTSLLKTLLNNG
jgi:preprotein translocase subunit SecE